MTKLPVPVPVVAAAPLPVEVANEEPLQVEVAALEPPTPVKTPDGKLSLPPTTTAQEDIVTAGQRQINYIWELTQAGIAVAVTLGMIFVPLGGVQNDTLENAFFLIVGFYFSRTNHTAIGGVGRKPAMPEYRGR